MPLIANAVTGANEADKHYTGVNCGRDYRARNDARPAQRRRRRSLPALRRQARSWCTASKSATSSSWARSIPSSLDAEFLDEKEQRHPIIMGCYGIGVNRIIAAPAETSHDENGLIWPLAIAPYAVLVIPLNVDDDDVLTTAERIYEELQAAGVDVLFDDRDAPAGVQVQGRRPDRHSAADRRRRQRD